MKDTFNNSDYHDYFYLTESWDGVVESDKEGTWLSEKNS